MDAFELLKEDHRKVSTLFQEIESAPVQTKRDLFEQLKSELDLHATIEETIFYPALENSEEAREITLEAYEEHKVVKDLLAELEGMTPDDEWSAKLTVLRENVEHHVEEEEGELFRKARQALTEDEIEQIGDEMQAAKATGQPATVQAVRSKGSPKSQKAAASKKSGERKGLLGTLASMVGLGSESKGESGESRSTRKASKVRSSSKSAKASSKSGRKAAQKSAKKASSRSAASSKSRSAGAGKKTGAKKSAAKKATKASKRTAAASKRTASKKRGAKSSKKSGRSKKR